MKPKSTLRNFLAALGSATIVISSASAQTTYYWDGNNDTAGFGTAGGTWAAPTSGTTTSGWTTSAAGTNVVNGTSVTTTTLDTLNFGTGSGATTLLSTGTITVSGTVDAGNMSFNGAVAQPIIFSGGTINFANSVTISMANAVAEIGSLITGATSITKTGGTSTLRLTNANNSYTAVHTIAGTLEVTHLANGGLNSSMGASSNAASNLLVGGGTLSYIGATNTSTDRLFTINTTGNPSGVASNGAGTVNFTNSGAIAFTGTGNRFLGLSGTNTGLNIFNPLVGDIAGGVTSVSKSGNGTWVLANNSNSYTGATQISNTGTLIINTLADFGTNSAIGRGTVGTGILFGSDGNTSNLIYTGGLQSSNRTIQINNNTGTSVGGARIINNGTGALTFNATNFNETYTAAATSNRALTLGGTNGGSVTGIIRDNSATAIVSFVKEGNGAWTLGGSNSYTGSTTLNAGTLTLDYAATNSSKLSNTATTGTLLLNGGTLALSGGSHAETVLSTTLNNGTTSLTRSGSSTLSMGNITFSGGALNIASAGIATTTSSNHSSGALASAAGAYRITLGGADWAKNDGSGNIIAFTAGDYTSFTGGATAADINYSSVGNVTLDANRGASTNTFKITTTAVGQTMDLNSRQLSLGSMLFAGAHNYAITNTSGRINSAFLLHNYATSGATLTLGATNGNITQYGTGKTILSGNNAGNSTLNVFGGTVQFSNNLQIGTNTGVVSIGMNNGTLIADTTGGNIALNNGGLNSRNIALGAGGGTLDVIGGGKLTVSGVISATTPTQLPTLTIGSASSDGTIEFTNANTYTGATTINAGTLVLTGATQATSAITFTGGSLGLDTGFPVTAANAAVDLTNGTIKVTGSTGAASYTLLTAASITGTPVLAAPVSGYQLQVIDGTTDELRLVQTGGGPGPLDKFAISAISSPQTVGTAITGITLTAQDASNQTVTSFNGTVTFSGTGGFSGTSGSFTNGVLSGVSVTPTLSGSNLTLVVTDGVSGKTGSQTIATIQSQYQAWASGAVFDADANGDGVSNGLAFLLGATGPGVNALNKLPVPETIAGGLKLTFQMLPASARGGAALSLEHSNTLATGSWSTVAVPDSNNTVSDVVFTVTGTNPLNVTATIPVSKAASGKLFGRVKGTNP